MKSGTTSLYRWLGAQPEVSLPESKELNYFSHEEVWHRGLEWYSGHFAPAGQLITGEASVSYTSPALCETAADRIATVVPGVRLIYVVRHPLERLRSHYRHEVQRGRESRPLGAALEDPASSYVGHSLYSRRVRPFLERFPREQVCVIRFEDMVGAGHPAWTEVLEHLGLPSRDAPELAHNVTRTKPQYTRLLLRLWEADALGFTGRVPRPIRRFAKRILTKAGPSYDAALDGSEAAVATDITRAVWDDVAELARMLGTSPFWPDEVPE